MALQGSWESSPECCLLPPHTVHGASVILPPYFLFHSHPHEVFKPWWEMLAGSQSYREAPMS